MPHILTIDDEPVIREILSEVLADRGYRVTQAETVPEALAVVRNDPPDLIVTDLQLEDSDGFELVDEVKQIAPGIPVILLTGVLFDPATLDRLGEKKIAAYVAKTAPLEQILHEIKRVLGAK